MTASTLKEKVAKMDLQDKLEKGDIGKHAVSVLSKAKDEVDFGLHGRDTMAKLSKARRKGSIQKRLA